MKCDFLIIGQGIAGTTLALELISRGSEVLVIDVFDEHNSSRVAAGLFNALVFKRITLGWRAKESLKEAH
ncbi:MAG TPA: FAD-dependent oxidoreductase, partial [Flavobacteriales bacterium]|nr:FAD-dependent oxidoreductase [Flavobacteriales bacterium]